MHARTRTASYDTERKLFVFFIGASFLFVALYAYFLVSTVATIALREEHAMRVRALSSEVSQLEAAYLSKKQGVSTELAFSLGFVSVANPLYIDRTELSTVALSAIR
jgi:hypothetical protein